MKLKFQILMLVCAVFFTAQTTYAQTPINSAQLTVYDNPAVSQIAYVCSTGNVQVTASATFVGSTPLQYTIVSTVPNTLPLPPSNNTGTFNLTGAYSALVRVTNNGCTKDTTIQFQCGGYALPLVLLNFSATLYQTNMGYLFWKVENEKDVVYYIVEKSIDGVNFSYLGKVMATSINSNTKNYSLIDSSLAQGYNYYRLKAYHSDGTWLQSQIEKLYYSTSKNNTLQVKVVQNPAQRKLVLSAQATKPTSLTLTMYNAAGQLVKLESNWKVVAGTNIKEIDISNLADGNYFLRYQTADNEQAGLKFLVRNR